MAATQEDSFREIQLSGKALVFVFMAGTVILVGVFLMGLLVGRGVLATSGRAGRGQPRPQAEAEPPLAPPPPPAPRRPSPATAGEKLSYAERLGSAEPAKEQLKPDAPPAPAANPAGAEGRKHRSVSGSARRPRRRQPRADAGAGRSAPASTEPAGAGFAIQVAALRERTKRT